jgi:hypothetical protein
MENQGMPHPQNGKVFDGIMSWTPKFGPEVKR